MKLSRKRRSGSSVAEPTRSLPRSTHLRVHTAAPPPPRRGWCSNIVNLYTHSHKSPSGMAVEEHAESLALTWASGHSYLFKMDSAAASAHDISNVVKEEGVSRAIKNTTYCTNCVFAVRPSVRRVRLE